VTENIDVDSFRGVKTTWVFWAISDDYGEYAEYRMGQIAGGNGKIHDAENLTIWVKTWAQVLEDNRARMQFFQERLEYEADKGASLKHLQEHYAKFLQGVVVEDAEVSSPQQESTPVSS
jgi:hypothetical protein